MKRKKKVREKRDRYLKKEIREGEREREREGGREKERERVKGKWVGKSWL